MAPELVSEAPECSVQPSPDSADSPHEPAQGAVPLEVLERNLTSWAGHIAAAEAQWLGWLGEYCHRQGWAEWGCSGPTHWLQWQCGMAPQTARDKVRVAMALRDLPVIAKAFGQGRLSYSKVRALTRVADASNDAHLAGLGIEATGAQLDKIVRAFAATRRPSAGSAWEQRSYTARSGTDQGLTVVKVALPDDQARLLSRSVNAEVDRMIDDGVEQQSGEISRCEYIASRGGIAALRADALVALAMGTARTNEPIAADVTLVATDAAQTEDAAQSEETWTATHDGVELQRPVAERMCCDPRIAALVEDAKGTAIGVGRLTRLISRGLRRALDRRDAGCCQFPGCGARRRLHAHHIVHWANGGPTDLDNLILVCGFHHHLVHEGGWNVDRQTRNFIKPNGDMVHALPDHAPRFRGSATKVGNNATFDSPRPLAEAAYEPFDLGLTIETLCQGPAIPSGLERQRQADAHRERTSWPAFN